MKRALGALTAAATAVAMLAAPSAADEQRVDRAALQQDLDDVVDAGAVGALAEVRDGRTVWRGGSGVAEVGTTRPVPPHGRFRAGSITKSFVATVVLQLVDEGRLRLSDPVERWLPGVVPDDGRITIRHLLDHTSGLPDILPTLTRPPDPAFLDYRWRTWTADELVRRALTQPPTFEPPGSAFAYSNTNYTLLGMVIEEVTGRSYGAEVTRRLIRPLHLRATDMPGGWPWIVGPHPHGYVPIDQGAGVELVDYTTTNPSLFGAGGELLSTAHDLNRFFAALLRGRLLPDHLLAQMKHPGVEGGRYGLGLAWRGTSCGVRLYGNDGDALTYQSWSFATEDARRQVTVALTPDFSADPDDAVDALLDRAACE